MLDDYESSLRQRPDMMDGWMQRRRVEPPCLSARGVNYQAPSVSAAVGRLALRTVPVVAARLRHLAHEPRRSAWRPAAMRRLLGRRAWVVAADDDLVTLAESIPMPIRNRRSLRAGRIVVADR